jgi:hypothetical protein
VTAPFTYPSGPLLRRHAPAGYASPEGYRPWLRDDFSYRCVYCLRREKWGRVVAEFAIDHFLPVVHRPDLMTAYNNLLYACVSCNARKSDEFLPDPCVALTADSIHVHPDGTIEGRTRGARRVIRVLYLDRSRETDFRRIWIETIALARASNPSLLRDYLKWPEDLQDLSRLQPPGGNTKPDGLLTSAYHRRQILELPETY